MRVLDLSLSLHGSIHGDRALRASTEAAARARGRGGGAVVVLEGLHVRGAGTRSRLFPLSFSLTLSKSTVSLLKSLGASLSASSRCLRIARCNKRRRSKKGERKSIFFFEKYNVFAKRVDRKRKKKKKKNIFSFIKNERPSPLSLSRTALARIAMRNKETKNQTNERHFANEKFFFSKNNISPPEGQ